MDDSTNQTEAVPMAPMIRFEAELRAVVPPVSLQRTSKTDWLESIFLRPHMFCENVSNLRELMIFIDGFCGGQKPPHGNGLPSLNEYVTKRFNRRSLDRWTKILLEEFGFLSFADACAAIAGILREWKASNGHA